MTQREQLYYLLESYNRGEYDIVTFCEQLSSILYYESSAINELDDYEREHFGTLGDVAQRYSPYKEDHILFPKAFCTDDDVNAAVKNTCLMLNKRH